MSERAGDAPLPSVHIVLPGGDFLCCQRNLGPRFKPDSVASMPACGVCLMAALAVAGQAESVAGAAGRPALSVSEAAEALITSKWGDEQLIRPDALREWAALHADFPFTTTVGSGAQR